jgi:hypothetical protein
MVMNLKDEIEFDKKCLDDATITLGIHYQEYKPHLDGFNRVSQLIERKHQDILDRFEIIINNQIEHSHHCDCCRPSYYDYMWFTENGIMGRIDADHPNDIRDREWTWEEVEVILATGDGRED